jgi:GNAT superfamily N-acetyltransferase
MVASALMAATVRELGSADVPRLLDLIDGLADYERLPRPTAEARARLARDATSDPPRFKTLLAELNGQVVGYAIYFFTYSSFLARPSLYLEDIFVLPDQRGRGAGRALFRACAAEAVRQECGRMEWSVLAWNQPSIEFYRRSGAEMLDEWRGCRLTGDALAAAARE